MKENIENVSWYTIQNLEKLDTLALVTYPERVKKNIELLKSMIDDPARLRPHVKTHKSKEVTRLLQDAGIHKFKCATIAEAEMLAQCNAEDVLLAYQPVGPKLDRFLTLVRRYPGTLFSCLLDNIQSAKHLSARATEAGLIIPVFLDINVGMIRTGIQPGPESVALFEACIALPGIQPLGLHVYDGHIHEKDFEKRREFCDEAFAPVRLL